MALSMFLRSSACMNLRCNKQILNLAKQPNLSYPALAPLSTLSTKSFVFNDNKCRQLQPILNSVRSFQTTPARLSSSQSDHAKLWVVERVTAGALLALIPVGLMLPNKVIDVSLAILMTAHSFWGLEAIAVDYVRASIFGTMIPKLTIGLVYLISFATLGGLFYIISHDVGICNAIRNLWAVKSNQN